VSSKKKKKEIRSPGVGSAIKGERAKWRVVIVSEWLGICCLATATALGGLPPTSKKKIAQSFVESRDFKPTTSLIAQHKRIKTNIFFLNQ
jgi:hypothetical protein